MAAVGVVILSLAGPLTVLWPVEPDGWLPGALVLVALLATPVVTCALALVAARHSPVWARLLLWLVAGLAAAQVPVIVVALTDSADSAFFLGLYAWVGGGAVQGVLGVLALTVRFGHDFLEAGRGEAGGAPGGPLAR